MDTISKLAGPLVGLWLAIVGIAIVAGVLFAIGGALRQRKRHRSGTDPVSRAG